MKTIPAILSRQALSALAVSTMAFTVGFVARTMFDVIGIPIKKAFDLHTTKFGLPTAASMLIVAHSSTWRVMQLMWASWICLFLPSYPPTDSSIVTADGFSFAG